MSKIFNHFETAYEELIHKVTWPTWSELQQTTIITLAGIILMTVVIFAMDGASELVFENFYKFFK